MLKLRQALGAAQRRDTLDAELRTAEAKLAPLPAIVTADPQATMAADLLAWISAGRLSLTPHDIHRLRVTGLTVIPALAGIIFLFATTLLRRRTAARRLSVGSTDRTRPPPNGTRCSRSGPTSGPLTANTASWNLSPAFTCVPSTTRLGMLRPWMVAGTWIAAAAGHLAIDPDFPVVVDQNVEHGLRGLAQIDIADPRGDREQRAKPHESGQAGAPAHPEVLGLDLLPFRVVELGRHGARLDLVRRLVAFLVDGRGHFDDLDVSDPPLGAERGGPFVGHQVDDMRRRQRRRHDRQRRGRRLRES